jgi:hypothetical protein
MRNGFEALHGSIRNQPGNQGETAVPVPLSPGPPRARPLGGLPCSSANVLAFGHSRREVDFIPIGIVCIMALVVVAYSRSYSQPRYSEPPPKRDDPFRRFARVEAPSGPGLCTTRAFDEKVESLIVDSHEGANRIQDPHWCKGGQS